MSSAAAALFFADASSYGLPFGVWYLHEACQGGWVWRWGLFCGEKRACKAAHMHRVHRLWAWCVALLLAGLCRKIKHSKRCRTGEAWRKLQRK